MGSKRSHAFMLQIRDKFMSAWHATTPPGPLLRRSGRKSRRSRSRPGSSSPWDERISAAWQAHWRFVSPAAGGGDQLTQLGVRDLDPLVDPIHLGDQINGQTSTGAAHDIPRPHRGRAGRGPGRRTGTFLASPGRSSSSRPCRRLTVWVQAWPSSSR